MRTDRLFGKYYFSRPDFVDGTTQFHHLCRTFIAPTSRILEIGSGPSNPTSAYLASLGHLVGLDVSDEVRDNRFLQESHVFDGNGPFPFEGGAFDVCVSNYVLEHIRHPATHFREVMRALRPGGVYLFRTPNLWHYVALAGKLLPRRISHRLANPLRGFGGDAHKPYPAYYRANTRRAITGFCRTTGFRVAEIRFIETEPSYGRLHELLFFPMWAYERVVNSSARLEPFRANVLAVLSKPTVSGPATSA